VQDGSLIPRFLGARRDRSLAVLEGLHALKHALRFGARVQVAVTDDRAELARLAGRLSPDVAERVLALACDVDPETFGALAPYPPSTHVVALAERPSVDLLALLSASEPAPVVLLEDPRDLGNVGACVRVAAAADVAGVLTLAGHDPWHPDALRGSAGLHFALPVAHAPSLAALAVADRPLVAVDPAGQPIDPSELDPRAVLAFGGERRGLSRELLARAERRVSIPMRAGVSSLNLATSVAAVLYAWRLAARSVSPLA
jgi:TrmH family RNA methyltransferase